MKLVNTAISAAFALGSMSIFGTLPASAEDQADVKIGSLICYQSDKTNLVVYSTSDFDCTFEDVDGSSEKFTAKISKVGVDLSTSREAVMNWYVFAPSTTTDGSALEGNYVGASADASLGAGAGARVLTGGFDRSFTLQPASVSGEVGIGASVGVESLKLKHRN
ncbi:MAG: DUF992 domain-containing protein [Pseudomonadota bacterium]